MRIINVWTEERERGRERGKTGDGRNCIKRSLMVTVHRIPSG